MDTIKEALTFDDVLLLTTDILNVLPSNDTNLQIFFTINKQWIRYSTSNISYWYTVQEVIGIAIRNL